MKIKRIIAREWLIFLVCVFIGTASYILDDYLVWKKKREIRQSNINFRPIEKGEEIINFRPDKYNFTGIEKLDRLKRGYKFGKGYSKHDYFLFLPYFLTLFIRSIVWSITQLRGKL